MEANGKMFLKVVGILMVVFGAIGIIVDFLAVIGSFALIALGASIMVLVTCVVALASAAIELAVGIIGIVNCDKVEKADLCLMGGIVTAGLCVLGSLILPIITPGSSVSVFGLLTGLVCPILFCIGALKNKGVM